MKKNTTFNAVSYAMLRGGFLIMAALLVSAVLFLLKIDKGDIDTYIYGQYAETLVTLAPLMMLEAVIAAFYFERQFRRGRAREDRMKDL